MDSVLAINIINEKTFLQSMAVEVQAITNRIIDVYLPIIAGSISFSKIGGGKKGSPLSLLQIADRSRNKTPMPGTAAGHYSRHV
jgi:hypothetical protein